MERFQFQFRLPIVARKNPFRLELRQSMARQQAIRIKQQTTRLIEDVSYYFLDYRFLCRQYHWLIAASENMIRWRVPIIAFIRRIYFSANLAIEKWTRSLESNLIC